MTPRLLRAAARWALSRWPQRVRSGVGKGLRMDLRRASAWYARGDNEPALQAALQSVLGPGGVFFDIGANVGFFSLIAARLVGPSGRVAAFEPVPANAAAIRRNAALNGLANIVVVEAAVCADDGESQMVLTRHPGGAVLAGRTLPPDAFGRAAVRTVSIDRLVEQGVIPPPTLVKIDVEGAELEVLRGMGATARAHRPQIICELDDETAQAVEAKVGAAVAVLNEWGFSVSRLEQAYGSGVAHLLASPMPRAAPA